MGSSTYHPQSKQQGRHSPLSLSQAEPLPPSYTTSSGSGTSSGSHSPSHINFHPPRVSAFASSTFASHNNHPHHHHPHHPNTIQHPHPPLHDRIGAHEEGEQRYGTPSQSSLSLATTTALASATSSTPYASTSYLPSTSASITTFDAAPPLLHSATTPLPSASSSTVGLHQPPSIITTMGLPHHQHHSHQQQKDKSQLSIILDAPYLTLKGTGPDVEPTTLSGHVLLHLTESTTLKEITLQFRGKAKIPMPANESLINNSTSITYVVCNHDWSFLESGSSSGHTSTQGSSSKKHSRTLKAGNHYFPFSLAIGGTLPSSTSTSALGGASVVYKLRAVATRPGFAHNLQAIAPVPLLRTFTPEALEYQQTLEIENTWPDKMMYAIMLPHKAWAAGDVLGAVVKFSPLSKGVRVASVVSTLWETSKIFARSGTQEETRPVCSTRHEIVDGRAVEVDWSQHGAEKHKLGFSFTGASQPAPAQGHRDFGHHGSDSISSSSSSTALTEAARRRQQREEEEERERQMGYENNDIVTCITMPIPPSSCSDPATPSGMHHPTSPLATTSSHFASFSYPNSGTSTPVTSSTPPTLVTPSHSLEPIVVSHRLRWSIYIRNRDGHISELRCSLPVVILDGRLKEEARDASMISRRMMIRSCVGLEEMSHEDEEVWGIDALGQDVGGSVGGAGGLIGEEGAGRGGGDRELPSYNAHVRDRVANMFLPEAVTMRVNNPWINRSGPTSPTAVPDSNADPMGSNTSSTMPTSTLAMNAAGTTTSSAASEHSAYPHADVMSHLPHAPSSSGTSTPLDWVNSELLLSLGDDPMRRLGGGGTGGADSGATGGGPGSGSFSPLPAGMRTPPSVLQYVSPVPVVASGSRWGSRGGSRAGSRAGSPERGGGDHQVTHHGPGEERDRDERSRPSSPVNAPTTIGYVYEPLPSAAHSTHTSQTDSSSHHDSSHSHGLRLHNLFKATMKPFTALSHKNRHDDKDKDHQHHQREGRSGVPSREGSSGGNSRSSREHSPITTTNETPLTSAASTYTYDSALNSPMSSAMSHDLFAAAFSGPGPSGSGSAEDQSQSRDHVNSNFGSSSQQTSMPLSMSTSELAALRRTAISSPYSQGNAQQQQQRRPLTGPALLHRALTEVPDYSIASRGFLGGVPPLTSMRGLPSYQEAVGSPQAGRTPSPLSGGGGVETTDGSTTTAATTPAVPAPLRSASSEPDLASHFTLSSSQSQSQPRPHPHLHTHTHDQDPLSVHVIDRALAATALEEEEDALAETDGVGILQRLESAGAISGMGGGVGASDVGHGHVEEPEDEEDEEGGSGGSGIEMRMRSRTITQNPQ